MQTAIDWEVRVAVVSTVALTSYIGYALSKRTEPIEDRAIAAIPSTSNKEPIDKKSTQEDTSKKNIKH